MQTKEMRTFQPGIEQKPPVATVSKGLECKEMSNEYKYLGCTTRLSPEKNLVHRTKELQ